MTKEASGHWYLQDGTQLLTVPRKKDGHPIKTSLTHARMRGDLAPGCTTIIKEASAPQLTTWMIQQGILAALTLPRGDDEPEADWLSRVDKDRQTQGRQAAEIGSQIHLALEQRFTGRTFDPVYTEHVEGVVRLLEKHCPGEDWQSEVGVTHSIGFGTKIDIHGRLWILDFKGKETGPKGLPKFTYSSHWLQLGAGREALLECERRADYNRGEGIECGEERPGPNYEPDESHGIPQHLIDAVDTVLVVKPVDILVEPPKRRAAIVYVSRDLPGDCEFVEVREEQLQIGWQAFQCLMLHWQTMHTYAPTWCRRLRLTQEQIA